MKDGFIKVAAAAPEMHLADCAFNAASIIASAHNAAERGADLFVTPELSITGYTCGDLFFQRTLQDAAEKGVEAVLCGTAELPMLVAVGAPVRHLGKLYNCAVLLYQGQTTESDGRISSRQPSASYVRGSPLLPHPRSH